MGILAGSNRLNKRGESGVPAHCVAMASGPQLARWVSRGWTQGDGKVLTGESCRRGTQRHCQG